MAVTEVVNQRLTEYKVLITHHFKNIFTSSELSVATTPTAIQMLQSEGGGDGSVDKATVFRGWVETKPLAMKFFTTASTANTDFKTTILSTPAVTAADALPSTYIALHAETVGNEPKIAGVLALRALGVDSTYKDDGANLGAGAAGAVLSDANVMALYGTWGAKKFNAILNKNVLKTIVNESNTSYDTLAEVATLYSAWTGTVSTTDFFGALNKMVGKGVSGLKFSELYAHVNSATNFNKYTTDGVITLMASTGGSWSAVTGLGAAAFTALTSPNAIKAIQYGGATFTSLNTVYTADVTKFTSLTSNNAVALMSKGYSGFDFAGLSTGYGTTYTTAKDIEFNTIVDPAYQELIQKGVTYAHMAALYTADLLKSFTPDLKSIMAADPANYDTVANDLITPTNFAGLETINGIQ